MTRSKLFVPVLLATTGLAALLGTFAVADAPKEAAKGPELQLPPGWTAEDMQACIAAATPGKNHELMAKDAGKWEGKSTMWMAPGAPPVTSDCTSTVTSILDGHYVKIEHAGEMPGMGPYNGFGIAGYDNVAKKFVATWIDNQSTGIMKGDGTLSPDGKTMTWNYEFNCPLQKTPAKMRQIEKTDGNKKTIEMYGPEPKSGKEYKIMVIELMKK